MVRKKSKSKESTKTKLRELGDVEIKMWVQPSIGKKPQWVKIPIKGTLFNQLQEQMAGYDRSLVQEADISIPLIKLWYAKLRKETALKIQRIKSTRKKSLIDKYFNIARIIFCNYLTYQNFKSPLGDGRPAAGYLRTQTSVNDIILNNRKLVNHASFSRMSEEKQQIALRESERKKCAFKDFKTLRTQCSSYENRLADIWDIYSQIDQFPAGAFGKMPCTQYFNDFKNQVKYIVSSPYGYVDFLLYGGWITEKDARAEMSMSPDAWKKGQAAGRKAVSFMQLRYFIFLLLLL